MSNGNRDDRNQNSSPRGTNVISLTAARRLRETSADDQSYIANIYVMDKLALLEEMVRFQEERSARGFLTPSMMIRGKILFAALEKHAETQELRLLTGSYRRHLEHEYHSYLRTADGSVPTSVDEDLALELDEYEREEE